MSADYLFELGRALRNGKPRGITSVCTAHPEVIATTLAHGCDLAAPVLIEATCNQVNQAGGYTGMTPADFRRFVFAIADHVGFPTERLILGGDHLGPNPWRKLPPHDAMDKAKVLVRDYVEAGFTKIHLDASMACAGDPVSLPPEIVAQRAVKLAEIAEEAAKKVGVSAPLYVIGTEVPVPGGALEQINALEVTSPQNASETMDLHKAMFARAGLLDACERVIGLVVQPGVEFGNHNVIAFDPPRASPLIHWLKTQNIFVFEAHSTDYQTGTALSALVDGGFCILKVGPGLTFALREAYYALDAIAGEINAAYSTGSLPNTMERLMMAQPGHWAPYYDGDDQTLHLMRHFSYSDRIRYYWARPEARNAVADLMQALGDAPIPQTLVSQFMPALYPACMSGELIPTASALLDAHVRGVLDTYACATRAVAPRGG